jgi:hypothetical protein
MEYTVEAVQQQGMQFVVTVGPHSVTTVWAMLKPTTPITSSFRIEP